MSRSRVPAGRLHPSDVSTPRPGTLARDQTLPAAAVFRHPRESHEQLPPLLPAVRRAAVSVSTAGDGGIVALGSPLSTPRFPQVDQMIRICGLCKGTAANNELNTASA